MRLRDLEIVWAVSRSRNMREAGASLGVSQPAVSRALRYTVACPLKSGPP